MSILKIAENILKDGYVCDNCLGRQFAQLLSGYTNNERGKIVRFLIAAEIDKDERIKIDKSNITGFKFRHYKSKKLTGKKEECKVCGGMFKNLGKTAGKIANELKEYEFDTFQIGIKLSENLLKREEKLWDVVGIEHCESIKNELSREIGKKVEKLTKKQADIKRPNVVVLLDLENNKIGLTVNALYIYGKYNKYKRGLPQTRWPCSKCRGLGCKDCDYTGRQFKESIEELISEPLLKMTKGVNTKLHGAGREDRDAKCTAGREFVIEAEEPRKRSIDLKKLEKQINDKNKRKISVSDLRFSDRKEIIELKDKKADKTYKVVVELEKPIKESDLKNLNKLTSTIKQKTPERVSHRRAIKTRKREVKGIKWKFLNDKKIELKITTSAGLYVKELISGDNGRTHPSVCSVLKIPARVKILDVIKIE